MSQELKVCPLCHYSGKLDQDICPVIGQGKSSYECLNNHECIKYRTELAIQARGKNYFRIIKKR